MRIQYMLDKQVMLRLKDIAAAQAYTLGTGSINGEPIKPIRRGQSAWRKDAAKVKR